MENEIRLEMEIEGVKEVKSLLEKHEDLLSDLHKNMRSIEQTVLEINLRINQSLEKD